MMREAEESKQWKELRNSASSVPTRTVAVAGSELDVTDPALVLGGRNGAGKSRVLRALHDNPDESTVYIDLHHVCEQALTVLRSREDLDSMVEEYGELELSRQRIDDLQRVIGRNYESVAWYALELEPSDSAAKESFLWGSDTSLVPYFRAKYHGVEYASPEMGLGELSMHMLFWILEQYRDVPGLTLLLDEPDAYLPPVGVKALLHRILALCADRKWRVVLSTHSEEMISQAVAEEAFVYIRTDVDGSLVLDQSAGNPNVAESLLTRPAMSSGACR